MKRFLIALFICSVPFSAKATLLGDFYDLLFEKDSEVTENAPQENETSQTVYIEVPEEYQVISYNGTTLSKIDSKLREYVDPTDFKYMKEHGEGFYKAPKKGNTLGYYSPNKNIIALIEEVLLSFEKANVQEAIHHEVQHQKDVIMLKEKIGYDPQKTPSLNALTTSFMYSVLEARAYTEEMEFLYNKKNELYKRMEELEKAKKELQTSTFLLADGIFDPRYNELKKLVEDTSALLGIGHYGDEMKVTDVWGGNNVSAENMEFLYQKVKELCGQFEKRYDGATYPSAIAFRKAMEESEGMDEDERIKKARRASAVALLNSDWFKNNYIISYLKEDSEGFYIGPEVIINALGEDYFTMEDFFYAAEKYWVNVCDSGRTTDFTDCQSFWGRYETRYCPDLKKKWSTCARLYEVATAEKDCNRICFKHSIRRLTNKEDKEIYGKCCHNISYSPLSGVTKEEKEVIEENKNLTKEDLISELINEDKKIKLFKERLEQKPSKSVREQQLLDIEERTNQLKKDLSKMTKEELLRKKFKERKNPFAGE